MIRRGTLFQRLAPKEYYFIKYDGYPDFEDRDAGVLAFEKGYRVGEKVNIEIRVRKKKN